MIYKNGKKVSELYIAGKKVSEVYSNGQLVYKQSTPTPTTIGQFTINSNGDKVGFATGNLQYQASTGLWRFAQNQWDFVGDSTDGNVYENGTKCDNSLISSSYTGWIDLFGYGCNGENNGQIEYMPYSTSSNNGDYINYNLPYNADWGYAWEQQTGESGWRTLTKDELDYIINQRAGYRFAKCQIDNQYNCLILFSDGYNPYQQGLNGINNTSALFTSNSLTINKANDLTNEGCLILPCGGYRDIVSIYSINQFGLYATSTGYIATRQYIDFNDGGINILLSGFQYGYAIRLAQDISN